MSLRRAMGEETPQRPQPYAFLQDVFERVMNGAGFIPTVSGVDRHGSIAWEAVRLDNLNRYVMLGFTILEHDPSGLGGKMILDGYVGADNGSEFHRKHVDIEAHIMSHDKTLRRALEKMVEQASSFTEADLDEAFVVPREADTPPVSSPTRP
jgi:hypothetical protein